MLLLLKFLITGFYTLLFFKHPAPSLILLLILGLVNGLVLNLMGKAEITLRNISLMFLLSFILASLAGLGGVVLGKMLNLDLARCFISWFICVLAFMVVTQDRIPKEA